MEHCSEPVGLFLHSFYGSLEKSGSFKPTVISDYFSFFGGIHNTLRHLFHNYCYDMTFKTDFKMVLHI